MSIKRIATLVAGIAVSGALVAGAQVTLAGDPAPVTGTPRSGTSVADGADYRFTLPEGWKKESTKHDGIGRIDTYRDSNGNYFKVLVFSDDKPFGSGYAADTTWRLTFTRDRNGFAVATKDPTCTPSELSSDCTAGNGKLEIYAMVAGTDDVFVRGNAFQLDFGNDRAETDVDTAVFEEMIGSFRIK